MISRLKAATHSLRLIPKPSLHIQFKSDLLSVPQNMSQKMPRERANTDFIGELKEMQSLAQELSNQIETRHEKHPLDDYREYRSQYSEIDAHFLSRALEDVLPYAAILKSIQKAQSATEQKAGVKAWKKVFKKLWEVKGEGRFDEDSRQPALLAECLWMGANKFGTEHFQQEILQAYNFYCNHRHRGLLFLVCQMVDLKTVKLPSLDHLMWLTINADMTVPQNLAALQALWDCSHSLPLRILGDDAWDGEYGFLELPDDWGKCVEKLLLMGRSEIAWNLFERLEHDCLFTRGGSDNLDPLVEAFVKHGSCEQALEAKHRQDNQSEMREE